MNEPRTWSDAALPPGMAFDDERQPVPVVDHPYFTRPGHTSRTDDATAPEPIESSRAEVVRELIAILKNGPPSGMSARLAALEYHWRISDVSIRELATEAGRGVATVTRAIQKLERYLERRKHEKAERHAHL
jgi:hypothetical protein